MSDQYWWQSKWGVVMKLTEHAVALGLAIYAAVASQGCNETRRMEVGVTTATPGGAVQRGSNPATRDRSITGVGFQLMPEPPPTPGARGFDPPFIVEFKAADFDAKKGVFYRPCVNWSVEASKSAVFQVKILDSTRKGQEVYGRLVVFYDLNGTEATLPFDPIWVTVQPDSSP